MRRIVPEGIDHYDRYGWSLDMDLSRTVVGAYRADDEKGRTYVWRNGELEAVITPPNAKANDRSGQAVAIWYPWLAIGSPDADDAANSGGVVDLFHHSTQWEHVARLTPESAEPFMRFGYAVTMHEHLLAVSSLAGPAYHAGLVHVYYLGTGEHVQDVFPYEYYHPNEGNPGMAQSLFGSSVALRKNILAVGAWRYYKNGGESGGAFTFRWDGNRFNTLARLLPPNAGTLDRFGDSIDTDGTNVIVGASNFNNNRIGGTWGPGAAFIFTPEGELRREFHGSAEGYRLGQDVAIDGDRVLIGTTAPSITHNYSGVVQIYDGQDLIANYTAAGVTRLGHAVAARNGRHAITAQASYAADTPTITELPPIMTTIPRPKVQPLVHNTDDPIAPNQNVQIGVPFDIVCHLFISPDEDSVPARPDAEIWVHVVNTDQDILMQVGHPAVGPTPDDPDNPRNIRLETREVLVPSLIDIVAGGMKLVIYYGGRTVADALAESTETIIAAVNLSGDTNFDGVVNSDDLDNTILNWGKTLNP